MHHPSDPTSLTSDLSPRVRRSLPDRNGLVRLVQVAALLLAAGCTSSDSDPKDDTDPPGSGPDERGPAEPYTGTIMGKLVYTTDLEAGCDGLTPNYAVLVEEDLELKVLSFNSQGPEVHWDPLGKLLPILSTTSNMGDCFYHFHLIDASGNQRAEIMLDNPTSPWGRLHADWTPGGDTLAFSEPTGDVSAYTIGDEEPVTIHEDFGPGITLITDPRYSPDGSQLLLVKVDSETTASFWLIDSDGGNPTHLFDRIALGSYVENHFDPTWLNDMEFLFRQPRVGLFHVDLFSPGLPKITQVLAGDYQPYQLSEGGMWAALLRRVDRSVEIRSATDWQLFTTIKWEEMGDSVSEGGLAVAWSPLASELAIITREKLFLYQLDQDKLSTLPFSMYGGYITKYMTWGR